MFNGGRARAVATGEGFDEMKRDTPAECPFLTPTELAARWGVSTQTVINHCRAGKIACMKVGRQYRIHRAAVDDAEAASIPPPVKKPALALNVPDYLSDLQ